MNRRGFLGRLAGAAAAAVMAAELDPGRLLWVPGTKTFFLPPEKRLISGLEAVQELSRREQVTLERKIEIKTGVKVPHRYTVSTGAGRFEFDENWSMLRANGKAVTIDQAAAYHATLFQRQNVNYMTQAERESAARFVTTLRQRQGLQSLKVGTSEESSSPDRAFAARFTKDTY